MKEEPNELILTTQEQVFFKKLIEDSVQKDSFKHVTGKKWTPRAIRALFMKYQFARLIISALNEPFSSEKLCQAFARKLNERPISEKDQHLKSENHLSFYDKIINEVF